MQELEIQKQLIVEEDLALENAPTVQKRAGTSYDVTPMRLFKIVRTLEELKEVDVEKFTQSVLFGSPEGYPYNNVFYSWQPNSSLEEDEPKVIASNKSVSGRWVEQNFISAGRLSGSFVTMDTEQTIEKQADKKWLCDNIFMGENSFGQVVLGEGDGATNLRLALVDARGNKFQLDGYVGFETENGEDLFLVNNRTGGQIVLGNDLNFKGDPKYINNVEVAEDPNQAVPKKQLDEAVDNLQEQIDKNAEDIQALGEELATEVERLEGKIDQNTQKINQNAQNIASNTQKINQNTSAINQNAQNIASNTQKINQNTSAINQNTQQINENTQQINENTQQISENTQQISENTQSIADNTQDIASNTQGLVDANSRLDQLSEKVDRIQTGVIIGQIDKTKDEVEVDREGILDAYVMSAKNREPLEGDSVYTEDSFGYYRHASAWSEPYTITINIATTTTVGLVKSVDNTADNRGKIKVESSTGVMDIVKGDKIAYKDVVNAFEEDNTFNKNVNVLGSLTAGDASTIKKSLTIQDISGSADLDKASLIVQGYARARSSLTADKGFYAGMDHSDGDGGNALFRVQRYPENPSLTEGAYYNKVLDNPADDEVINQRWLEKYVANNATGGDVYLANTQTFTGSNTFNGAVYFDGNTSFRGDQVTISSDSLIVTSRHIGMGTANSTLTFQGTASFSQAVSFNGNVKLGLSSSNTLTVAATATFKTPVTGVTPTQDAHLATKKYVDDAVAESSGDFVTLDTNQTVTGQKNFTGGLIASGVHVNGGITTYGNTVLGSNNSSSTHSVYGNAQFSRCITCSDIPTSSMHLTNKKYVDEAIAAAGGGSAPTNMVTTDTTQTITGQKTFSGYAYYSKTPTASNEIANKAYVDSKAGGGDVYLANNNIFTGTNSFRNVTLISGYTLTASGNISSSGTNSWTGPNTFRNMTLSSGYTFTASGSISSSGSNTWSGTNTFTGYFYAQGSYSYLQASYNYIKGSYAYLASTYTYLQSTNTYFTGSYVYFNNSYTYFGDSTSDSLSFRGTSTFSGNATFNGYAYYSKTPTASNEIANKAYVDSKVGSGGGGDVYKAQRNVFSLNGTGSLNTGSFIDHSGSYKPFMWSGNYGYMGVRSGSPGSGTFLALCVNSSSPSSYNALWLSYGTWTNDNPSSNPSSHRVYIQGYGSTNIWQWTSTCVLQNATLATRSIQMDPVWDQDYTTMNYVNQKLQQLYDHIDARLKVLEEAAGLPSLARAGDSDMFKASLSRASVPKSPMMEKYEEIKSLPGYEDIILSANADELEKLFGATSKEEWIVTLQEVKARLKEEEESIHSKEAANANQPI